MRGMGRPTDQERLKAVKTLAERHGITRVDEVYEDGETLLSRAAGCEACLDLLRLLIAAGADVNHADADGCTPLYRACTAFNTEGARLLVEGGADVKRRWKRRRKRGRRNAPNSYERQWGDLQFAIGETLERKQAQN